MNKTISGTLCAFIRRSLLVLLGFVSPAMVWADIVIPEGFAVNGVPVLVDVSAKCVYATVIPDSADRLVLSFTTGTGNDTVMIDGKLVPPGNQHVISALTRRNAHTLRLSSKKTDDFYKIYFTTMPLVAITTASNINTSTHTAGSFKLIDPLKRTDGKNYVFEHRAGLRWRGASSSGYPKKSYAVELWDDYNQEVDTTVIGFRSDGDVILDAAYIDYSRFRNRLLTDIWNAMDSIPYASSDESKENGTIGHFVEVLLNGSYNGIYCLTDKIDRKKLHLKKLQEEVDGSYKIRGLLWKGYTWSKGTYLEGYSKQPSSKTTWEGWELKYPDEYVSTDSWTPLKKFIDWAAPALNSSVSSIDNEMEEHVYPQNVANYMLLINAFVITDNSIKNVYLSQRNTQKDQRVLFTPWDMDASMGRTWYGSKSDVRPFDNSKMSICKFFYRLLVSEEHPSFRKLFRETWDRLKHNVLSPDSVASRIRAYRDEFYKSGAWTREMAKWTGMSLLPISEEAEYMIDFYSDNYNIIQDYLSDFPSVIDELKVNAVPLSIDCDGRNIVVASPTAQTARVSIYDISGVMRRSGEVSLPYTADGLPAGVYVVVAKVGNTLCKEKVLLR